LGKSNHEDGDKGVRLTLDSLKASGRATISVEEAGQLLAIGRGKAYDCARNGEIPCLSLGRLKLVPVPALLRMLGDRE
jgi:excisionase family DNA binding protein